MEREEKEDCTKGKGRHLGGGGIIPLQTPLSRTSQGTEDLTFMTTCCHLLVTGQKKCTFTTTLGEVIFFSLLFGVSNIFSQ